MIELIVVLMLLSVMLAMAAPSLRGWGRGAKLTDATREVLATAHWARAEAIASATTHRLEINTTSNTYLVTRLDGTAYTPVAGEFGQANALPIGFALQLVSGGVDGNGVEFYPTARCTPAMLRVVSPTGETHELACNFPADVMRIVSPNGGTR